MKIEDVLGATETNRFYSHQESMEKNLLDNYSLEKENWKEDITRVCEMSLKTYEAFNILNEVFGRGTLKDRKDMLTELERASEKIEMERQDLSHMMENTRLNAHKGYQAYKEYHEASKLRRMIKDSIYYLRILSNEDLQKSIQKVNMSIGKMQGVDNAPKYHYRVRTDLEGIGTCSSYLSRVENLNENNKGDEQSEGVP